MDKDFMQYVYVRVEKALTDNKEYMDFERNKDADPNELQAKPKYYVIIKDLMMLLN